MRAGRCILSLALIMLITACAIQGWQKTNLSQASYSGETQDLGVATTNIMRTSDYEVPTPTVIEGASTIRTPQLRDMMLLPTPPILIDVLGGNQTVSLPEAVWLPGAGSGHLMRRPFGIACRSALSNLLEETRRGRLCSSACPRRAGCLTTRPSVPWHWATERFSGVAVAARRG